MSLQHYRAVPFRSPCWLLSILGSSSHHSLSLHKNQVSFLFLFLNWITNRQSVKYIPYSLIYIVKARHPYRILHWRMDKVITEITPMYEGPLCVSVHQKALRVTQKLEILQGTNCLTISNFPMLGTLPNPEWLSIHWAELYYFKWGLIFKIFIQRHLEKS